MPTIQRLSGHAITPYIDDLARLRIAVFRDFPYLYDGSLAYEADYLRHYSATPESVVVLVQDEGRVVGASTGMPLVAADPAFQAPFAANGYDIARIFYFGESVLEAAYRGQGLGVRFFAEREAHVRQLGRFDLAAFCAVERPADHPARPVDYVPLDGFWQRRGYVRLPELVASFSWPDMGEAEETAKPLVFWLRPLKG